jgi:hypothetical protein
MSTRRSLRAGAAATYLLVGLMALLIGAAAMWTYKGEAKAAGPAPGGDPATTHGEWVHISRGRDSIRA